MIVAIPGQISREVPILDRRFANAATKRHNSMRDSMCLVGIEQSALSVSISQSHNPKKFTNNAKRVDGPNLAG
jgi:hypothetical protein